MRSFFVGWRCHGGDWVEIRKSESRAKDQSRDISSILLSSALDQALYRDFSISS